MEHKTIEELLTMLENIHQNNLLSEKEYQSFKENLEFQKISSKYSDEPHAIQIGGRSTTTDEVYDFFEFLEQEKAKGGEQRHR